MQSPAFNILMPRALLRVRRYGHSSDRKLRYILNIHSFEHNIALEMMSYLDIAVTIVLNNANKVK